MYPVKTPWLLKQLYPGFIWDLKPAARCIYLTFDDGPIPIVTPFVLNILKKYQAKATFFCVGDNVRKHPEIFDQVKSEGHTIGNHTYNHLKGWHTPNDVYLKNFLQANEQLHSQFFRPPYGRVKRAQVKLFKAARPDLKIVMWDVLSGDFDTTLKPKMCLQNVIQNTQSGSIVLFHDSLKAYPRMAYALPRAMEYWSEKGFKFSGL